MLTRKQWAAKHRERLETGNLTLKERVEQWKRNPPPNVVVQDAGVPAAPCQHRGCIQYPSVHSHSFSHWPPPSASAKYQWLNLQYQEPENLTSEWVEAEEGDKCKAPRTRCKVNLGDAMLRRKETGDKFCRKHGFYAVHGLPGTPGWSRLVTIHQNAQRARTLRDSTSTDSQQSTQTSTSGRRYKERGEFTRSEPSSTASSV